MSRIMLKNLTAEETFYVWLSLYEPLFVQKSKRGSPISRDSDLKKLVMEHLTSCKDCRKLVDFVKDLDGEEQEKYFLPDLNSELAELSEQMDQAVHLLTKRMQEDKHFAVITRAEMIVGNQKRIAEEKEHYSSKGKFISVAANYKCFVNDLLLFAKHLGISAEEI